MKNKSITSKALLSKSYLNNAWDINNKYCKQLSLKDDLVVTDSNTSIPVELSPKSVMKCIHTAR